ncbi:polysaccharide deacetylase family protein [Pararhizobium antarcticum]|uniref:Polysaccharide deacetylase n=1 Tax=Pararhizobium antarcticum TaxID=1798805 RepID=A0A657LNJ7_9HYPH|nr:polysaccharide deacetylase family protein [Pararhizobium antarcticum]OJF92343.1 polysaccharide deacetylase [Pararhizobium antarcticum]OJF94776.1 polysaccharide deacetylase [Rhizobium sp. 58]
MTTDATIWAPLVRELDRWHDAGKTATFWLRDDDAIEPTAALDRLLAVTGRHSAPVTLAVIPAGTGAALADRLRPVSHATVAVHGWAHVNHAPEGKKKQELGGPARPLETVLAELGVGFGRLSALFGTGFVPLLVPPWNRIDAGLLPLLGDIGFTALSVYGAEKPGPIRMLNTHVDVMDWHGTRGGRDPAVLVEETAARLQRIFVDGGTVGVLTHHLVHDETVWAFLYGLFTVTAGHPACNWASVRECLVNA